MTNEDIMAMTTVIFAVVLLGFLLVGGGVQCSVHLEFDQEKTQKVEGK